MEKWIEVLFSEEILNEAAARYHADVSKAKKLGDFENYVFEVQRDGQPFILRLTHSSHRSRQDVEAELQWVNHLHDQGLNVSLVHESSAGRLVEEIPIADTAFFVCLFEKAPGNMVKMDDPLFGPALFEKWGETVGKMHQVTKDYEPGDSRRERWDEEDLLKFNVYLDVDRDREIISVADDLITELKDLPETKESFGLIHSDLHSGNFFYENGEIHVFDFDDSTYHYYASDIAIPLYYPVWGKHRNDSYEVRSRYGEEFLFHFLKGYQKENHLDQEWIKRIPLFLRLRDFVLYTVFHKKWDMANLNEKQAVLVRQIRERILRNELISEISYDKILHRLHQSKSGKTI
ncbi:phosphotransferase enzyme family protein [Thalassobacillus pellis]|uniref:phosphotransferase enzyme family protein n=1 Tax=Thalassobacillus pellis TaxID=748008 RepID=UPI001961FB3C|nr:phosphotransferase [Thalassobacillus pellis]MBM7552193.1 Ser/Thr protein kinase RdoA (MazF antagonist) [Thalassobacillus pellis]